MKWKTLGRTTEHLRVVVIREELIDLVEEEE